MKRIILKHYTGNRKKYLFLFMSYILGILLGYLFLSFCSEEMITELSGFMSENIKSFMSHSENLDKKAYFSEVAVKESLAFILMWILGLSTLGVFYAPLFILYKGFILGFCCAFMLKCFDGAGLLFDICVLVSQNIIKVPVLIFACMCTISHSLKKMPSAANRNMASPASLMAIYSMYMLLSFGAYLAGIYFECYIVPHFVFLFGEGVV